MDRSRVNLAVGRTLGEPGVNAGWGPLSEVLLALLVLLPLTTLNDAAAVVPPPPAGHAELGSSAEDGLLQQQLGKERDILKAALDTTPSEVWKDALRSRLAQVDSEWGDELMLSAAKTEDKTRKRELTSAALVHFKAALGFRRQAEDRQGEFRSFYDLASAYYDLGEDRKGAACFAQAGAIAKEFHRPSLCRQVAISVLKPVVAFFSVIGATPAWTLVLALLFAAISAIAARLTHVPVTRIAFCGSGLGLAFYSAGMAATGWVVGGFGNAFSYNGFVTVAALVLLLAGVLAWATVRGIADHSARRIRRGASRFSSIVKGLGFVNLSIVLLCILIFACAYALEPEPTCTIFRTGLEFW